MGNSSSHQHCPTNLPGHDMGRGWTQSFPRELTRHHSQPPGHKVLPEPPNQRLRATNNGSIIHNGGTISGRRPSALTLPHDLNKQGVYRSRSTSASNLSARSRGDHAPQPCCNNYHPCSTCTPEMLEIKRFGSEPDLRYSPPEQPRRHTETRHSGFYPERETRYRGKKKYKAPAPPTNAENSSPDSYKWEIIEERESPRENGIVQPPPRRSRLFKTRAETKRQSHNWQTQENHENVLENEKRLRSSDRVSKEARWREYNEDRWSRDERRKSKKFDGKNTLQRSLSSPEFQAELMQVARKVRNKLQHNGRVGPVGAAAVLNDVHISKSMSSIIESDNRERKREVRRIKGRGIEEPFENRREEIRNSARFYEEKKGKVRKENRVIRQEIVENGVQRRKIVEKISYEESTVNDNSGKVNGHCQVERRSEAGKNRRNEEIRSESPRQFRDRMDVRGQGSGRESTPEPPRGKDKKIVDNRRKRNDKDENLNDKYKNHTKVVEIGEKNWNCNGISEKEKHQKKFYSTNGDDRVTGESKNNRIQKRINERDYSKSQIELDEIKIQNEDIALKLRPTLPKKQLEIPRFSPSAAWRLLSALETPGPAMSTASEEVPVMYEERIERLSRPPPPQLALGPRSSHDKSGDSGISGDAGGPVEDSPNISTNRLKSQATRATWTPQQDLGEESSSDAGVDSPPPMPPTVKFPPRAHVFSLSLPRDDNRHVYTLEKTKENDSFNSLQKIKRSVSGAFGLASGGFEKRRGSELNDNWLLSTSAPTSLQHSQVNPINRSGDNPPWENYEDFEERVGEDKTDFPGVMKPPSFSYLAAGGHVMYLPSSHDSNRTQSLNHRNSVQEEANKNGEKEFKGLRGRNSNRNSAPNGFVNGLNNRISSKSKENLSIYRERSFVDLGNRDRKSSNFSKSCENISEMKQRSGSPGDEPESLQDKKNDNCRVSIKPNPKGKRFTFQSTVRQIERRRLAEKLSREAEVKERQRKSELEAMRKVEEEFQRKRAKEKANIRQQLRLYSMDENTSLPPGWDSHLSRADPDGAPSSSASSPTSAPPGKHSNRKASVSSDEYHRKKECRIQQQSQPREYKDYRPKYYDWAGSNESSSHLEVKLTTVHPKVVCDIPKSSHVFVDANTHAGKNNSNSTPRSDNYRKDFAHGAVAAKSSLASSDSELSQPNTRPHSRQNGNKNSKPVRTRF